MSWEVNLQVPEISIILLSLCINKSIVLREAQRLQIALPLASTALQQFLYGTVHQICPRLHSIFMHPFSLRYGPGAAAGLGKMDDSALVKVSTDFLNLWEGQYHLTLSFCIFSRVMTCNNFKFPVIYLSLASMANIAINFSLACPLLH